MKKNMIISLIAFATALVGAIVAIVMFMKRKCKKMQEELEFDEANYVENDPIVVDAEVAVDETVEEDTTEEPVMEEMLDADFGELQAEGKVK